MMKKTALIIVWFCGFALMASAQTFTNNRILDQAAIAYKLAFNANYTKAMAMAKQRGWPTTIDSKNGRRGVLVGVDELGYPKYYMTDYNTIAAATTRANQLWPGGSTGLNLSGSSANMKNKLGIWDGGAVLGTHVELVGRVTQKDNPSSIIDHATHVTGTMMATGVVPVVKGMAFGLQGIIAYDFTSDIAEITAEAGNLLVSNHSYSIIAGWNYNDTQARWEFNGLPNDTEDYKFGFYSSDAASLDDIAYNAPYYLIVKSAGNVRAYNGPAVGSPYYRYNSSGQMVSAGNRPAGISSNDGYDIISWDCGAKNILTVGAVGGLPNGYTRKEDIQATNFSAWGPTDDGRIKPDVVADGVSVYSCIAASTTSYAYYDGTSMSSPNAAGSLLLLQEYYSKLKAGAFLRSATLKGLAIHTADEAGPSPGPDYQYGWGLLDVQKAAAVITAAVPSNNASTSAHLLYENTLAQGGSFSTNVVASGNGPLQATICWTDVKGTVETTNLLNNRNKKLVNDLDIRVTTTNGTLTSTFMPWTLDVNNPSLAAVPGDNTTDNAERIDIDSTVPGRTYTITVTHKGTLAKGSQAYSLLVSGVGGTAYCTSASGGGGARIDNVTFKTINVTNPAGSKTYTDYTKNVADIEPGQTIPISIKVSTADATTNPRIVKVFIDLNNNGTFESSELMATSAVITSAAQTYTGSIVVPIGLTIGNISLMRIIVQETSNASDISACGTYGKGETEDYRVHVVSPSNDLSVINVTAPAVGECASTAQFFAMEIKNNGSVDQANVPITISAATGGTLLNNLSFTYPGTIPAYKSVIYTFQVPSITAAGTTYNITATASLSTDQNPANNTLALAITTTPKPAAPVAIADICVSIAQMKVVSPDPAANYFWYTSATSTTPFAIGTSTNTATITSDKTYYVAKEARASLGPTNKSFYTSGGYNTFRGNYVKINNSVPVVIQTARMYFSYGGKVRFTVANLISSNSDGSYTYQQLAQNTIDVYATTPAVVPGAVTGNNAADTGAVFLLNLPVSLVGDHIIIVECLNSNGDTSNAASIFRNNSISGTTTYPNGVSNIMSITGNSANTGGSLESQFYYFFYDMRVISAGVCLSDRVSVLAVAPTTPVITQQADSLISSVASGNQWYLNDTGIAGATLNHYKPTKAGKYKVIYTDAFGCQVISNVITYTVTAIANVDPQAIGLVVSPNPNNGVFNLSFKVTTKADLTIDILSSSGQRVYSSTYPNFTGSFSKQIEVDRVSSEFYILQVQHNKKSYVQKILIQR
jgi:hypothetical protein